MTDLIISFINLLFGSFMSLLPDFNFNSSTYSSVESGFTSVVSFLADVNFIVPLSDIFIIISIKLALCLFKMGLFTGNWIIRRIADIIP